MPQKYLPSLAAPVDTMGFMAMEKMKTREETLIRAQILTLAETRLF